MNYHVKTKLSLLSTVIFLLGFWGCSNYSGPSDAEVKKMIEESIVANQSKITSPVEILDKGKRKQKDSWFFIARTSYKHSVYGDSTRETIYFLRKTKDKTGKTLWKIIDASDVKVDK